MPTSPLSRFSPDEGVVPEEPPRLTICSEIAVIAADGARNVALQIAPPYLEATDPVVLFLPAMGAPASYYEPFARALAASGRVAVALLDLRGQGRSSERASHFAEFGFREIVEFDIPAAIAAIRARHPRRPILLAGHSLGGQLATLVAARNFAELGPTARGVAGPSGLILIASGTARVGAWPGLAGTRMRIAAAAIRFAAALLPWYPGRVLGFGGDQPRRLMRDWGRLTRTGCYRLEGSTYDYELALPCLGIPVLSLRVEGDSIAPAAAAEELVAKLGAARIDRTEVRGLQRLRPWKRHFGWARSPETVLEPLLAWIQRRQFGQR
jgi:predicted alpha/beta hydrolase